MLSFSISIIGVAKGFWRGMMGGEGNRYVMGFVDSEMGISRGR